MDAPTYRFRLSRFRKETTYRLTDRALAWSDGESDGALAFADIRQIRIYDSPGVNELPGFTRCTIRPAAGRAVILSSNHFAGLADWQSRSGSFRPFVDALLRRAALGNPRIAFISGMPVAMWIVWTVLLAALVVITPVAIYIAVMESRTMSPGSLVTLLISIGMLLGIYPLLQIVRHNRPRPFDGREGYPAG